MGRVGTTRTMEQQQPLRRKTLSSSSSYFKSDNKTPLSTRKDNTHRTQRLANLESSTTMDTDSHHRNPVEENLSYFPDHVARVSYIASVVKPEITGNYLQDLQRGMTFLAYRLAPSYFPGTIVTQITTQVDGYFPSACPSAEFSNCQDVTASIGIYLRAVPFMDEGSDDVSSPRAGSSSIQSIGVMKQVDPSTMTEELLAFQDSLVVAIANNELQDAIQSPAVVIVTDTANNIDVAASTESNSGMIDDSNTVGQSGSLDDTIDASGATIEISVDTPTTSASSIPTAENSDSFRNVGLATIGITGTALMSILLVLFLAMGNRRRHGGNRREEEVLVNVKEKIKKHHRNRHSKAKKFDDCDQSGQELLESAYNNANDVSRSGDEEEGFTGRTMRTTTTDSIRTTSSHETLLRLVATSSSLYNDLNSETITASSSKHSSRKMFEENASNANDLTTTDIVSGDDVISFRDDVHSCNNGTVAYTASRDDDEDDNDFVLGEDDDSEGSVGQHLLSVSRSSDFCSVPSQSPKESGSPTRADDISSPETMKETNNSDISFPKRLENSKSGLQEPGAVPSLDSFTEDVDRFSELDAAIANNDWVTVGATAAFFASETQPPIVRRAKVQASSSSTTKLSDFAQKAEELDKLIEAGDWKAVVATAAKYEMEGESIGGSATEEDANRSRTSTQGSDANDSCVSIMDNSSEGRSMNRSVATSASQKERIQEIRTQVIELVRDVVPEEEHNVDEMMIQFKDREDELLETLLSMKEKLVARKARVESQKMAKRNTRLRDETEQFESAGPISETPNPNKTERHDGSKTEQQEKMDSTRTDHERAASDAATWAIQRSLNEMMEIQGNAPP